MKSNYTLLNSKIVHNNLINLRQLTFEVTDACNLQCKYCGYGEFYDDYDARKNQNLSIKQAINILEYLEKLWNSSSANSYKTNTYISFYGGEPLLNMKFIREVVNWVKSRDILSCNFIFGMTTNGMLLDENLEYLVENNFKLLISLDGNEDNHSYRVTHSGENSYKKVYTNIKKIQKEHPIFFDKNISFNSVLHNRNDFSSLINFFKREFDKEPSIAELNPMGIKKTRLDEFSKMYNSREDSLNSVSNNEALKETIFMTNPETNQLCSFLYKHTGNVFKSYNDLLFDESKAKWIPTGTCLPFGKKMFVTVSGKILTCERVSHEHALGYVNEKEVVIDLEAIVEKYNELYNKFIPQCSNCYHNHTCKHCMFYNSDLKGIAACDEFMGKITYDKFVKRNYKYLAENPSLYSKLMEEVIIH